MVVNKILIWIVLEKLQNIVKNWNNNRELEKQFLVKENISSSWPHKCVVKKHSVFGTFVYKNIYIYKF